MLTQKRTNHFAQRVMRSLFVCARHARLGTLGVVLLLAIGCGGGGGSGGGQDTPAAISSTPVDLAPGQTTAMLAWEPSEGEVSNYFVLESRNGSGFSFVGFSSSPATEISGVPGDSVRIQVIAQSTNGEVSTASPPSVAIRFHAAVAAATAIAPETPGVAPVASSSVSAVEAESTRSTEASESSTSASNGEIETDPEPAEEILSTSNAPATIDAALRARLLGADLRFPFQNGSQDAAQWIQSHVDVEMGGGLSLVGTGKANQDGFRELVWADRSGQLFVSDGEASTATGISETRLTETIRLLATERFAGLSDYDGDGIGDWLIEDTATLEVWMVNGDTQETIAVLPPGQNEASGASARLAGHGDFDGDGQSEFLWTYPDGSLRLARATSALPSIDWRDGPTSSFNLETSELLTVADLDGDGRDDLLFRDANGQLQAALSTPGDGNILLAPSAWSQRSTEGLELLATLDLDGDGRAELAWHDGFALEFWDDSGSF